MPRPSTQTIAPDLRKSGALIFDTHKRLLLCREYGQHIWIFVGGRLESQESPEQALVREVKEEIGVDIKGKPTLYYTSLIKPAATMPGKTIQLYLYLTKISGTPHPGNEIAELHWLDRDEFMNGTVPITDTLQLEVLPKLIKEGLF